MRHFALCCICFTLLVALSSRTAFAHCQVPCGVYDDQRRFEEMLEDTETITKAITSINDLAAQSDALSKNQLSRWVNTKESHASNTQRIIAEYFMAQRIKPDAPDYEKKLTSAHAVIIAAMKCKQTVSEASAKSLRDAILAFHAAYEGKKAAAIGTWKLNFTTPDGIRRTPTVVVKPTKYGLLASYADTTGRELTVKKAELKKDMFVMDVASVHDGTPVFVTFEGKPNGTTMKGTMSYEFRDSVGDVPFAAKLVH